MFKRPLHKYQWITLVAISLLPLSFITLLVIFCLAKLSSPLLFTVMDIIEPINNWLLIPGIFFFAIWMSYCLPLFKANDQLWIVRQLENPKVNLKRVKSLLRSHVVPLPILLGLYAFFAFIFSFDKFSMGPRTGSPDITIFSLLLSGFVITSIISWRIDKLTIQRFEETLAKIHVCTECGYNLTGSVSPTCPECGHPIPGREKFDDDR